jgi:hypothetical protein
MNEIYSKVEINIFRTDIRKVWRYQRIPTDNTMAWTIFIPICLIMFHKNKSFNYNPKLTPMYIAIVFEKVDLKPWQW